MGGILDKLDEWLRRLLIEGITGNLSGMFDTVNTKVGEIAGEVGQTPLAWNSGVFSMIRNLSETVIVPIAGVILTFVMCYELIQLVTEKNNLHDVDTWMFFKWIFKTFCAVLIVTNTWNIVMGSRRICRAAPAGAEHFDFALCSGNGRRRDRHTHGNVQKCRPAAQDKNAERAANKIDGVDAGGRLDADEKTQLQRH